MCATRAGARQRTDASNTWCALPVTRSVRAALFSLPNLNALNFLLYEALDGGGTLSLRADPQGKTLGTALLRMEIEVEQGHV